MNVVRHQHIGVQLASIASGGFLKAIEICMVIVFIKETRFTVIAALDYMLRVRRSGKAEFARHDAGISLSTLM